MTTLTTVMIPEGSLVSLSGPLFATLQIRMLK